jgi:hypothetical protein
MPTFTKLASGSWRVQVGRKRQYVANTSIRRRDAEEWAIDVERSSIEASQSDAPGLTNSASSPI